MRPRYTTTNLTKTSMVKTPPSARLLALSMRVRLIGILRSRSNSRHGSYTLHLLVNPRRRRRSIPNHCCRNMSLTPPFLRSPSVRYPKKRQSDVEFARETYLGRGSERCPLGTAIIGERVMLKESRTNGYRIATGIFVMAQR